MWPLCKNGFYRSGYSSWFHLWDWTGLVLLIPAPWLWLGLAGCHLWRGDLVSESLRVCAFHSLEAVRSYQPFVGNISFPWKLIKIHFVISMPVGSCRILLSCLYPFLLIDISSSPYTGVQMCACELIEAAHVYAKGGLLREMNKRISPHWFSTTEIILCIVSEDSILADILNFINLVYISPETFSAYLFIVL